MVGWKMGIQKVMSNNSKRIKKSAPWNRVRKGLEWGIKVKMCGKIKDKNKGTIMELGRIDNNKS
jgi:hypothetical protein